MTPASAQMLLSTLRAVKDSVSRLCSDHRDLHSSVSKVGKTIDKHFVPDYDSTTREEVRKMTLEAFSRYGLHREKNIS
jgi:hypothetical protein